VVVLQPKCLPTAWNLNSHYKVQVHKCKSPHKQAFSFWGSIIWVMLPLCGEPVLVQDRTCKVHFSPFPVLETTKNVPNFSPREKSPYLPLCSSLESMAKWMARYALSSSLSASPPPNSHKEWATISISKRMCKAKYLVVVCSGLAGPVTKAHYNQQDKMPEVINSISPKESFSSHIKTLSP